MGGVVSAIGDAIGGVVDAVGDIAGEILDVATKVVDAVAENPLLIVVAVAAPELLGTLAAEAGVVGEVLTVAETTTAVETGTAILEATGTTTAVASVETATAATVIEGGATVTEATQAVTLVNQGATVADAVATATSGAVQTSTLTELASTATETMTNAWQTLSTGAQNVSQIIGETLMPGVDPTISKVVGQIAVNTATNGGHLDEALLSTGLSFGTGLLGSEVADVTGSKLAGSVASNVTNQLVRTGDVNLTNLAGGTLGNLVGSGVADETGSKFAGSVASSLTNSTVRGVDPVTGLINVGVNSAVNNGIDSVLGFSKSSGLDDAVTGEDQSGVTKTGSVASGLNAIAEADANNATPATGGLTQLAEKPSAKIEDITTSTGNATPSASVNDIAVQAPVTTGGLNQLATADTAADNIVTAQEPPIDAVKAVKPDDVVKPAEDALSGAAAVGATALTNQLTSGAKKVATGALTSALTGAKPAAQPSQQQMTAAQISASKPNKPPAQVDVSKLTAIAKPTTTAVKPQFVAAPLKADVSKLTPIKSVTGLTSILNQAKQPG